MSERLRFGSVCSGIEAASVAWGHMWDAAWFSEIEPFPCKVLDHHYPTVPNHGDMLTLPERIASGEVEAPDVLCGGTPCQAFSVAGLRKSLDDDRGNLSLTFVEIANAIDANRRAAGKSPAIVFWENVPGALNTHDGFFGCFLGALAGEDVPLEPAGGKWSNAGCVYGPERAVAWRVLNAQHFGVAQRRKRLYVVACSLEVAHPTQILFECEGSEGYPEQGGPQGEEVAGTLEASIGRSRGAGTPTSLLTVEQPYAVANCLTRRMHKGINTTLDEGQTPIISFPANLSGTQQAGESDQSVTLQSKNPTGVAQGLSVRRLLPVECERLQGFPDGWTDIPGASDTARYKALGNSWPVPVVRWVGERIHGAVR